jgi:hypothetical protein
MSRSDMRLPPLLLPCQERSVLATQDWRPASGRQEELISVFQSATERLRCHKHKHPARSVSLSTARLQPRGARPFRLSEELIGFWLYGEIRCSVQDNARTGSAVHRGRNQYRYPGGWYGLREWVG